MPTKAILIYNKCVHIFIVCKFIVYLFCSRHCARYWGYKVLRTSCTSCLQLLTTGRYKRIGNVNAYGTCYDRGGTVCNEETSSKLEHWGRLSYGPEEQIGISQVKGEESMLECSKQE